MNVLEAVRQNTEYVKKIDELEKKLEKIEKFLKWCGEYTNDAFLYKKIEEYFK